jgi:hypothetical protein
MYTYKWKHYLVADNGYTGQYNRFLIKSVLSGEGERNLMSLMYPKKYEHRTCSKLLQHLEFAF